MTTKRMHMKIYSGKATRKEIMDAIRAIRYIPRQNKTAKEKKEDK